MLSVELGHLADILDSARQAKNVSTLAKQWSSRIHDAIWKSTVRVGHTMKQQRKLITFLFVLQVVNNIFAYETNGIL